MILNFIFIFAGLVGLVYSADKFVKGASNLSINLGISPILVAILILGLGTSLPEILVSSNAALEGSNLALGNAIGSNISNIALIIGVTALWIPITVKRKLLKKEFVLLLLTNAIGIYMLQDGYLSRMDSVILFIGLVFVLYFLISNAKYGDDKPTPVDSEEPLLSLKKSILFTFAGLIALILFSKLLVHGAIGLASAIGISDTIIGLTIVSVGTSLPELSACIAAAKQKNEDLAVGNIIGSNIFNILAVLAASGLIHPMEVPNEIIVRDLPLMGILTVGFFLVSFSPKGNAKINRAEALIFVSIFVSYIAILGLEATGSYSVTDFLTK